MIIIGSDHAGVNLKERIIEYLENSHLDCLDISYGEIEEADDYPDVAYQICKKVLENEANFGIAICGTGIGISIACNKVKGIRAALCTNTQMAEMARRHNNSNVLCLGARLECTKNFEDVKEIINSFVDSFYEKGRHERRLLKIQEIENESYKGDIKDGSSI